MGLVAPQHVGSSRAREWTCVSCIGRWLLYHWARREALANSSVCYLLFVKIANVIFLSWMDLEMMQPPSEDWILPVLILPSEYSPTFVLCSFSASHEIQPSHSSICIHLFLPTCNPFFKICSRATKSFTAATKWICLFVPWDVRAVWAFMSLYSALSCCCLCIFFISLPLHIWILNLSDQGLISFWSYLSLSFGCYARKEWEMELGHEMMGFCTEVWEAMLCRGAKFATPKCVSLAWNLTEADYFFLCFVFLFLFLAAWLAGS